MGSARLAGGCRPPAGSESDKLARSLEVVRVRGDDANIVEMVRVETGDGDASLTTLLAFAN